MLGDSMAKMTFFDPAPKLVYAENETIPTFFKAYTSKPAVAFYPEESEHHVTPPLAATLKVCLTSKHEGAVFRVGERKFRIQHVSGGFPYEPEMVGEVDENGPYFVMTALEEKDT